MKITLENIQLDNNTIFELLNKSKKQYENYLTITALGHDYKTESNCKSLNRDINHPLNIIIK